jgi:hypothetical protein
MFEPADVTMGLFRLPVRVLVRDAAQKELGSLLDSSHSTA